MAVARNVLSSMVLAAGMAVFGVAAQSLPTLQEFYFDDDTAAAAPQVVPADAPDLVDQLMKQRERGRKALDATVQLAGVAYAQGRPELGAELYGAAEKEAGANSLPGRMVRWNKGWDLYRSGDIDGALTAWHEAQAGMRGNPSWVPPTLALALWTQGRKDEAVKWYAAAVRTEPQRWSSSAGFAQQLPTWRDAERATLAEVQQAWATNPPVWP
ncbi:tetratricopeptide repeat protein [Stenotrophomonas oahuensis]|uniref:Tetratricopeptide repeat protein n=1 Tax=Stenotrophomonas oahuensis TaxID=3003271 RepID=A0ABY9YTW5_9GAMM|nr:tetratricopeptide repeat protein [Stenotrophomonas sp. A5586]WNH54153.1 tetratricopeptide repeat protein [Stenotrophomonas sp. A5586]